MTNTIGNPLSWGAHALGIAGHDVAEVARELGGRTSAEPIVQRIGMTDIMDALRLGVADFAALRTDVIAACLLYPVIGLALIWAAFHANALPLIFPLLSGFLLLGPAAAIGLYEMSRRREVGLKAGWGDAFRVLQSPRIAVMLILAAALFMVFFMWIVTAQTIYAATLGPDLPVSVMAFLGALFGTSAGWSMILIGVPVGFVFAAVVLAATVVSFPLLLDRPVGLPMAVMTSLRVTRKNPVTVGLWGLIVAVTMAVGAVPFLLGLAVVLPVLGHATWHLYRRAVAFRDEPAARAL